MFRRKTAIDGDDGAKQAIAEDAAMNQITNRLFKSPAQRPLGDREGLGKFLDRDYQLVIFRQLLRELGLKANPVVQDQILNLGDSIARDTIKRQSHQVRAADLDSLLIQVLALPDIAEEMKDSRSPLDPPTLERARHLQLVTEILTRMGTIAHHLKTLEVPRAAGLAAQERYRSEGTTIRAEVRDLCQASMQLRPPELYLVLPSG